MILQYAIVKNWIWRGMRNLEERSAISNQQSVVSTQLLRLSTLESDLEKGREQKGSRLRPVS